MDFLKFELDRKSGNYFCRERLSGKNYILGLFLLGEIGCSIYWISSYRECIFDDSQGTALSGNCTFLEKDGEYIYLSDLFPEDEDDLVQLKISRKQFAKILDDWEEKVCRKKPMEVLIKYENNVFIIETKGDTVEEMEVVIPQEELKIDFVKLSLVHNETYVCKEMSGLEMGIIGKFFSAIGFSREIFFSYRRWAFNDTFEMDTDIDTIIFKKDIDYVYLMDVKNLIELKMLRHKFAQIICDWEAKICKSRPKEVIINRKNGEFSIEIKK